MNQIPIANFVVKTTSSGTSIIDFRVDDGQVETPYTFDGRDSFDLDGTVGDSSDLTYNWSFSDDGSFGSSPQVTHTFSTPGVHSVILVVTDEDGAESIARELIVEIANPLPIIAVQILDAWHNGEQMTDSSALPPLTQLDWSRTFDEEGETFAAPHSMLYFDSDGTRDGDQMFEGKYVPLDVNSRIGTDLYNIYRDFGDGSPLNSQPNPWHSYSLPGDYTVSLTVRDAYGTGDVSRAYFDVKIDNPPVINEIFAQMKYLYLIQILSVRIFPILNPIWAWRFIEIRMSTTAPYRTGMRFCLRTSMFDGISILNLMQMETVTLQMTGSLQLQQQKVELLEFGRK